MKNRNALWMALACVVSACFVAGCSNSEDAPAAVASAPAVETVNIGLTSVKYTTLQVLKDNKVFETYYVDGHMIQETLTVKVPKLDTVGVITNNKYGAYYSKIKIKADSTYRLDSKLP